MSAGNLEAIRDWSNRYFYKKSDVNEFFMKINAGLKAYKLTLLSSKNATINVVENVASNPQSYSVQTDRSGIYSGLFFFSSGSSITCTCGSKTATVTLTDSVMTINVNEYVVGDLIPTAPPINDSHILESSRFDSDHSGYRAFDKGAGNREFVTAANARPSYIGWHFDNPVICTKITIQSVSDYQTSLTKELILQASNDGTNWIDLVTFTVLLSSVQTKDVDVPVELYNPYSYLRVYSDDNWRQSSSSSTNPNLSIAELTFYGYVPED